MKKLYLLLLTGFSLTAASAQLKLGIKAGANFSTITGEDYGTVKMIAGFNAGILASIPLNSKFSLQPEFMYSGQGAQSTEAGVTGTLHNHYMNIPVLIKYNNPTGIFVETGPQLGLLLSAQFKFPDFSENEKPNYKSTDLSWAFGLGYLFKDVNLGIDARYNLGLSNFINESYNGNAKNNVVQVGFFYLFGLKTAGDEHQL